MLANRTVLHPVKRQAATSLSGIAGAMYSKDLLGHKSSHSPAGQNLSPLYKCVDTTQAFYVGPSELGAKHLRDLFSRPARHCASLNARRWRIPFLLKAEHRRMCANAFMAGLWRRPRAGSPRTRSRVSVNRVSECESGNSRVD